MQASFGGPERPVYKTAHYDTSMIGYMHHNIVCPAVCRPNALHCGAQGRSWGL